jgi:Rps23 Pro-64 3,4-dihydroxylase Tpa1-like proline 4-hydroxylase
MNEKKLATRPFSRLGNASELYFNTIHSGRFIDFLQQITGIAGLITDPGLDGGGLHSIPTGGKFALHTDFNQHTVTKLENRLIFITYLNKDWLPSYGGALELWNIEEEKCEAEVFPLFGRSILFHESKRSLHGHPKPVEAPNGRPRRSACTAYYTNGRDRWGRHELSHHGRLQAAQRFTARKNHDSRQIYGPSYCCGRIPKAQGAVAKIA